MWAQQFTNIFAPISFISISLAFIRSIRNNKNYLVNKPLSFHNMSISRYNISYAISIFSIILYSIISILNFLVYLSILTYNVDILMLYLLLFFGIYDIIQYGLISGAPK